jgi:acyl-CoA hydrolase
VDQQRTVTLRFLAEPRDVNFGGKVHGGAVMKWIDQAGYACAAGWTGCYCVTVWVGGMHFLAPIRVGDLVEIRAMVIRTGRTSLDIAVDVYAGDPKSTSRQRSGHCVLVFVALDSDGQPTRVAAWRPTDPVDVALERWAARLGQLRRQMDAEIEQGLTALVAPPGFPGGPQGT